MKRIRDLGRYQKSVLLLMLAMILVFAVIYAMTISRVGFAYQDTILVPSQEKNSTVYSGKVHGQQTRFTVSEDKSVLFQCGEKTYGPYTAREDSAAIPKNHEMADVMTGVELRQGDRIVFRGAVLEYGDIRMLYKEDGTLDTDAIGFFFDDETVVMDESGNAIDPMEPSVLAVLDVMGEPELTHKGEWFAWCGAVFICMVNALLILYANELFRWDLAFRIRNADRAEPSDWEITGRYIGWTVLLIAALICFVTGLH